MIANSINPFHTNIPISIPSENVREPEIFFDLFRGYRNETLT